VELKPTGNLEFGKKPIHSIRNKLGVTGLDLAIASSTVKIGTSILTATGIDSVDKAYPIASTASMKRSGDSLPSSTRRQEMLALR
jgi:hypothetical protein